MAQRHYDDKVETETYGLASPPPQSPVVVTPSTAVSPTGSRLLAASMPNTAGPAPIVVPPLPPVVPKPPRDWVSLWLNVIGFMLIPLAAFVVWWIADDMVKK